MKNWNKIVILALLAGSMAACTTTKKEDEAAQQGDQTADSRQGAQDQGKFTGSPFEDPSNPLSKRTVYFDFDSSEIRTAGADKGHVLFARIMHGHECRVYLGTRRRFGDPCVIDAQDAISTGGCQCGKQGEDTGCE